MGNARVGQEEGGVVTMSCTDGSLAATCNQEGTKCSESYRKGHDIGEGIQVDFYFPLHRKMQQLFTVSGRGYLSQWSDLHDHDLLINFLDPSLPFYYSQEPVSSALFSWFLFWAQKTLQRQFFRPTGWQLLEQLCSLRQNTGCIPSNANQRQMG